MSSLYWPDPLQNPGDAGRRLTLDPDGNLRLYSLQKMNGRWDWIVTWQASLNHAEFMVSVDPIVCVVMIMLVGNVLAYKASNESSFVQLAHVEYYGSDLDFPKNLSFELCQEKLGGIEVTCILLIWFFLLRTTKHPDPDLASQGYVLTTRFKRFTFDELRKATRGFKEVIGRGASGTVYKGVLLDKRVAAIKRLNEADQGEAEFLAEVNTIGMLNHMYLIEMWGYCVEGKHKLLVYEYMEHGSLAENLSSNALDWKKRFQIAVGTAKGLAYLHEECLEWILHCDIKPQNILLDDDYQPRVADFGLSKLLSRSKIDHLSFSRMRGTRGYMAPEWVYNLPITSKVDVYSYGIVLLEIITGMGPNGMHTFDSGETREHKRLITLVREYINTGIATSKSWIEDIIDPMMASKYDKAKMELLVKVALQCVAEDKNERPTMNQVVEMLLSHED
uniref:non-specific serine/threonine protein kinase n=1 Tax=Fagus sylvatica TaxID=28930 RepID=A0A2N9FYJ7_FAGSY